MAVNPVDVCWQRVEEDDPVDIHEVVPVEPTEEVTLRTLLVRVRPVDVTTPRRDPSSCALGMPMGHSCSDSQDECTVASPHAVEMTPPRFESKLLPSLRHRPGVRRANGAVAWLMIPSTNGLGVARDEIPLDVRRSQRWWEAAGPGLPMVFSIQRHLSPRGRPSARSYARWALQSYIVVPGIGPVHSLGAEATQVDMFEASGTLPVRVWTLTDHTPPCNRIWRKAELPRALLSLGRFTVSRRKGARRWGCWVREWNALDLRSGILTATACAAADRRRNLDRRCSIIDLKEGPPLVHDAPSKTEPEA